MVTKMWMWIVPILISPIAMFVLRITVEYGKPAGLFDPRTQSWAFIFGDLIALPIAFGAAGSAWSNESVRSMGGSKWLAVSIIGGCIVAVVLHIIDRPRYIQTGNHARLLSPTKLWHDVVVYPVIASWLIYIGIPVLVHDFGSGTCWLALVSVVSWAGLGVIDMVFIRPNPTNQHPCWHDTIFCRF